MVTSATSSGAAEGKEFTSAYECVFEFLDFFSSNILIPGVTARAAGLVRDCVSVCTVCAAEVCEV